MGYSNLVFRFHNLILLILIPLVSILSTAGVAFCEDVAGSEILYLQDGQQLSGESIGFEDGNILFRLTDGEVRPVLLGLVDRLEYSNLKLDSEDSVLSDKLLVNNESQELPAVPPLITPTPDPLDVPPAPDSQELNVSPFDRVEEYCDLGWEYVEIWTKRLELGGTFLGGNTDRDYITTALHLEKSDNDNLFEFEIGGRWGQSNGIKDANRWYGNATMDIARTTNWIVFISDRNTYDEFENLNWRGTLSTGLGYRFINEKDKRLIVRIGPGGTHEIFTDPKLRRTTFDMFVELELHWPLSDHAKLEHKQTWTPSMDHEKILRVTTESGLLFKLDNKDRWNLKFGLLQTYNSVPSAGRKKNDYTGSVSLVYTRK